jgi:hypothetical protein
MASGRRFRNPLRAVFDIRREELPLALLMFGYFFLVITSLLRPDLRIRGTQRAL